MKKFINYLERKIEGCDALGGLEREKAVYQSVLKEYRKAIEVIHCCKSDSGQLPSFISKRNDKIYVNVVEDADVTEHWNEYLKTR